MKAVILHGVGNDHTGNWFPWLKTELEKNGFEKVWVPDLPGADHPNVDRYTKFLLSQGWDFQNSLLIGHSAGAVEILNLLENLPEGITINTAILVAVFKGGLGWDVLSDLENLKHDYSKIKQHTKKTIVVQSDDDPYAPLIDGKEIAEKLDGQFQIMHEFKHFSLGTDPRFKEFPELLEIIKAQVV